MKDYFDYILLCAFQVAVQYENKRELTLEQLHNYRIEICEENKNYYEDNFDGFEEQKYEKRLNSFYNTNVNMTPSVESDKICLFIDRYKDFFVYNNGIIYLNENISYEDIDDKRAELFYMEDSVGKGICSILLGFYDSLTCLDILGTTKVKEEVYKIIRLEKAIEYAYQNSQNLDAQDDIKVLYTLLASKLNQIGNKSQIELGAYSMIIRHIHKEYTKHTSTEVLSEHLIQNDKYYNLNEHEIDYSLSNKYQIAIFDTVDLAIYQLLSYINWIWDFKDPNSIPEIDFVDIDAYVEKLEEQEEEETNSYEDEFDDENESTDDYEEDDIENKIAQYYRNKKIEMGFYLNYINLINDYEKKYGSNENLEQCKKRLLYLLDGYGDNLYKKENFNKFINAINLSVFSKEDLDEYYMLSRVFLIDIAEGWTNDEYILQKVLFASTYYHLTKDRRIRKIINKYRNTIQGERIYNAISNHDFSGYTQTYNKVKNLSI